MTPETTMFHSLLFEKLALLFALLHHQLLLVLTLDMAVVVLLELDREVTA